MPTIYLTFESRYLTVGATGDKIWICVGSANILFLLALYTMEPLDYDHPRYCCKKILIVKQSYFLACLNYSLGIAGKWSLS